MRSGDETRGLGAPKAASEKAQTAVSEAYTSPKIDVFRTVISSLLPPTGNKLCAGIIFGTPGTAYLAECLRSFPSASLSVRIYLSSDDC